MTKKGIALIGMACVGKSKVGRELARQLRGQFVDNDDEIAERYKMPIQDVLSSIGEIAYLDSEAYVMMVSIRKHLGSKYSDGYVIFAPGGSIIYRDEAMQRLTETCTVVLLRLPVDVNIRRITPDRWRTIVGRGEMSPEELYWKRDKLYRHAVHHVVTVLPDVDPLCNAVRVADALGLTTPLNGGLQSKRVRNAAA